MFWRRYAHGYRPLLVWAESAQAADLIATIHATAIPLPVIFDIGPLLFDGVVEWADGPIFEWDEDEPL